MLASASSQVSAAALISLPAVCRPHLPRRTATEGHPCAGASVRNASRYRALLEGALPDIFESIQTAYRSAESKLVQDAMRRNVLRVLRIWRSWFLFSDDYLNGLQAGPCTRRHRQAAGSGSHEAVLAPCLHCMLDPSSASCVPAGATAPGSPALPVPGGADGRMRMAGHLPAAARPGGRGERSPAPGAGRAGAGGPGDPVQAQRHLSRGGQVGSCTRLQASGSPHAPLSCFAASCQRWGRAPTSSAVGGRERHGR